MSLRLLAACAGLVLLLTACGGSPEDDLVLDIPVPAPVAPDAGASDAETAPEVDTADAAYWTAGRVAALEAAKATFVPPPPKAADAGGAVDGGSADPAATGTDPAVTETDPAATSTDPAATPIDSTDPAAPPVATPTDPTVLPIPSPAPTTDPGTTIPTLPDEEPVFIVADRRAAVLISSCTTDAGTGQRRLAYSILLRQEVQGTIPRAGNDVEHSATSRTVLTAEQAADAPIAFVLVEDDATRTSDFVVPAKPELQVVDATGATHTLSLPSATISVEFCAAG